MAQKIVMPKLGLTMTEGTVGKWLKSEGDVISVGEGLLEVETDKLSNTIESSVAGILHKILVKEGETVPCLVPVAIIGDANEDVSGMFDDRKELAKDAKEKIEEKTQAPVISQKQDGKILASPAAKKLAKEKSIDLSKVTPSGPNGRITLEDVEKFINTPLTDAPVLDDKSVKASPLAYKIAEDQSVNLMDIHKDGRIMAKDVIDYASRNVQREEVINMNPMRKIIMNRMVSSKNISANVTLDISVDMTSLKSLKALLAKDDIKVSYTDFIVKIVSNVLLEFPMLNCSIDGDKIILKHYVNMGVAVSLDNGMGLLVPVVKDAHLKKLSEISKEIKALASSARAGNLSPDSLIGGTFTITNLGMYGIESFTPIINQPEVAILGVNTMIDTMVVIDNEPKVRPIMKLSLTIDHRVIDGSLGAMFLARVKKIMENPFLMLV